MSPSFTQLVSVALALAGSTLASPTLFAARASPSDIDSYLSAHNTVREAHGATDLVWNNTLATAAQNWANGCVFEHSGGSLGPYGGQYLPTSYSSISFFPFVARQFDL